MPIRIDGKAFLVCDISGSIDDKKLACYKKVYAYYDELYSGTTVIEHTTKAKFSNIGNVLLGNGTGGTYISSGLKLALGEIIGRNNPNDIVVICGDGDNWSEDNDRTYNILKVLTAHCHVAYHEFYPSTYTTTMYYHIKRNVSLNEGRLKIFKKLEDEEDIFGQKEVLEIKDMCNLKFRKFPFFATVRGDELDCWNWVDGEKLEVVGIHEAIDAEHNEYLLNVRNINRGWITARVVTHQIKF